MISTEWRRERDEGCQGITWDPEPLEVLLEEQEPAENEKGGQESQRKQKVFQLGFSLAAQAQNYCGLNKIKIDLVSRPGLEWWLYKVIWNPGSYHL